jgi:hypothetical protein
MFNTKNVVEWWNYGNYSSNNYGSHSLAFRYADGTITYFSYKTPIAIYDDNGLCIRENIWGPTTGKHLNWINKDKSIRVGSDIFEARLQALRDKYKK